VLDGASTYRGAVKMYMYPSVSSSWKRDGMWMGGGRGGRGEEGEGKMSVYAKAAVLLTGCVQVRTHVQFDCTSAKVYLDVHVHGNMYVLMWVWVHVRVRLCKCEMYTKASEQPSKSEAR